MRRKTILIIGILLVVLGATAFVASLSSADWDLSIFDLNEYKTDTYDINGDVLSLDITVESADVNIVPSKDEKCRVVCFEKEDGSHTVYLSSDGSLRIEAASAEKWYNNIGISLKTPKITVYLPVNNYGSLSVKCRTGDVTVDGGFSFTQADINARSSDIRHLFSVDGELNVTSVTGDVVIDNISASTLGVCVQTGDVNIKNASVTNDTLIRSTTGDINARGLRCSLLSVETTTGDVGLENVRCSALSAIGTSGDTVLTDVISDGFFTVSRNTGDIRLNLCDGANISLKTNTGDVYGNFLTKKSFDAKTNSGDVTVPDTHGNPCLITTNTGDVNITVKESE